MAGDKIIRTKTSLRGGFQTEGLDLVTVVVNGNVEPSDEWALFRLTDEGLPLYQMGGEFAMGIMGLYIDDKPAVQEIGRFSVEAEAIDARNKLSEEERERTFLRSVRPEP